MAAKGKTTHNDPQGEPNATVTLEPPQGNPFYFGYLDGITDPFAKGLTSTSLDGGVIFFNVETRYHLHILFLNFIERNLM